VTTLGRVCAAALVVTTACNHTESAAEQDATTAADRWTLVLSDLDEALLSVWGKGSDDVWVVGSDAGQGPIVLHTTKSGFERLDSESQGDLWWVTGQGHSVWMSGASGLVLRYDVRQGSFERFAPPGNETLYGIFAFGDDDVWAVGGIIEQGVGVIYRYDGSEWTRVTGLPPRTTESPFFKVWGRSSDDLWVVGFSEIALHFDGDTWQAFDVPQYAKLFTVHGNDDETLAVGGFGDGVMVRAAPDGLVDVSPAGAEQLNGVWLSSDGDALAVGVHGGLWWRHDNRWRDQVRHAPIVSLDYHSAYIDPDGGLWAVGGQIVSAPYGEGMLAHLGAAVAAKIGTKQSP
jgi:hypothetical protein